MKRGRGQCLRHTIAAYTFLRQATVFSFRDQFAHCPWVHVSHAGEQCENGYLCRSLPLPAVNARLLGGDLLAAYAAARQIVADYASEAAALSPVTVDAAKSTVASLPRRV